MSSDHAHSDTHAAGHDDGKVHAHISPANFYYAIFGALIFFTCLTVAVSYVHLGSLNLAVAILIASIKASLVVMFFMHLRYDNKFNAVMFVCGILFIGVFFAYTMNDTGRRQNELNDVQGNKVYLGDLVDKQAPGGFEPKPMEAPAAATGEHGGGGHGEAPAHH
jgi:cytochrome c oxidase subunit IV